MENELKKLKTIKDCEEYFEVVLIDARNMGHHMTREEVLEMEYENIKGENGINGVENCLYENWLNSKQTK